MTFGERLRSARENAGLTQNQLGAGVGVSNAYVSHLEKGRRVPNAELAAALEEKLQLPSGALGGEDEWAPSVKRRYSTAAILAAFEGVMASRASGTGAEALGYMGEVIESARTHGRMDLAWLAQRARIETEIDIGEFARASAHCAELLTAARKLNDNTLLSLAETQTALVERLRGNEAEAKAHGSAAVVASQRPDVPREHRAEALIAAIPTNPAQAAEWASMLRAMYPSLGGGSLKGKAAWTLGNVAFLAGEIDEAFHWQDEASKQLTPAGQFRTWVRWPRAAAEVRLHAGVLDGVPELLEEARKRVELASKPEEAAVLAIARARYATALKDTATARSIIVKALEEHEVEAATRGHMKMELSEIAASDGALGEAAAAALSAAQLFTGAGAVQEAQRSFEQWDSLRPTDSV